MILTKGMAHGTLPFKGAAEWNRVLGVVAKEAGPGGYIRAPLTWAVDAAPRWDIYDPFLAAVKAHGLRWIAQMNTTVPGGGEYQVPNLAQWGPVIRQVVRHYWPKGLKAYEVWNEWNTVTGNANGTMTATVMARLLREAQNAVHVEVDALPDARTLNLCAMGIGTLSLDALNAVYDVDPHFLSGYNVTTHHLYLSEDPYLPSYDPRTGAYKPRRAQSLFTVRKWLSDHGFAGVDLGITEGGYSGSKDAVRPPNVLTEAAQADLTVKFLGMVKAANDTLRIRFWCPFHPIEAGGFHYSGDGKDYDYDYWFDHLGMVRSDLSEKPVAPAYATFA